MPDDIGTLSVPVAPVPAAPPASASVRILSLTIDRLNAQLIIQYAVGTTPSPGLNAIRTITRPIPGGTMANINTVITTAISNDLPGNPGVTLP